MTKYYGKVGYAKPVEIEPGVWVDDVIEKSYYGLIDRNRSNTQNSNNVNDNVIISNIISIIADPYANNNFQHIRYVTYLGTKWTVTSVEVQSPRLVLTLGGVYNENEN